MARRGDPRPPRPNGVPDQLNNPWPAIEYPDELTLDPNEVHMGHPTAPGYKDVDPPRQGMESPGNGSPGIPMPYVAGRRGPGIPGTTPTGPMQPESGILEDEF
jgi:hypothetical protein